MILNIKTLIITVIFSFAVNSSKANARTLDNKLNNPKNNPTQNILPKHNHKTEGHFIGINYVSYTSTVEKTDISNSNDLKNQFNTSFLYESPSRSQKNFGIKYLYAFNFNNFFIAPEIFYEKINLKNRISENSFMKIQDYEHNYNYDDYRRYNYQKLKDNLGMKINIGYDINQTFSPFFSIGASRLRYENSFGYYSDYWKYFEFSGYNQLINNNLPISTALHKSKIIPTYGFGLKINLKNNFSITAEYNKMKFKSKVVANYINNEYINNEYSTWNIKENDPYPNYLYYSNITNLKVGLNYNF